MPNADPLVAPGTCLSPARIPYSTAPHRHYRHPLHDDLQLLVSLDAYDLTFPDLTAFVRLACMAKPFIHQTSDIHPPTLQKSSYSFLTVHFVKTHQLSVTFCQVIWTHGTALPTDQEIEAVNRHGLVRGIGALLFIVSLLSLICLNLRVYRDLYPPTRVCQSPECVNYRDGDEVATLTDVNTFRASLFTL
jgi:hypothetical protein